MSERRLGLSAMFTIVYTTLVSSVYFAVGVVADRAVGLTPVVFAAGALFFGLAAMTYLEGASLHQERGGSTVFARYAFNELVSFVAGWVVLLDYIILIAVTALTATDYLAAFWSPLGHGVAEILVALAIVALVAGANVLGLSPRRLRRLLPVAVADLGLQVLVIVLGLVLVLHPAAVAEGMSIGRAPTAAGLIFALTLATVAFTGLEAASGLAGEVRFGRRALARLAGGGTVLVLAVYVGIALVAVSALPGVRAPGHLTPMEVKAPIVAIVHAYPPHLLGRILGYVVAASAALTLVAAANSAMLGLSRLGYSLATNRQIPSALARLEPRRGTPFVMIAIAAVLAFVLVLPTNLEFLVGIYAFGALLAFTIAHVSICVLRYRDPQGRRPYAVPLGIRVAGRRLPVPAALGAVLAFAGWISVVVLHTGARYVGFGWLAFGLAMYVVYRRVDGSPLLRRVTVPERALREESREPSFGSMLVPIYGAALDDDIMQTAGRLAGDVGDDIEEKGATIEALWVFQVPMALPLDAPLPDGQRQRARAALQRAKAVGEEYEGVTVATVTVRARRAGYAIVDQARRRGVEAIVLAAEEPSRIRGGARLGGRGAASENFVGEVTKYVVRKAPCRVILTAPATDVATGEPPPSGDGAPPAAPQGAPSAAPVGARSTARENAAPAGPPAAPRPS